MFALRGLLARASSLNNPPFPSLLTTTTSLPPFFPPSPLPLSPPPSSLHHYLRKTFLKTASLIAHGCQAVAVLGEQPPAVVHLAFSYGRHLVRGGGRGWRCE